MESSWVDGFSRLSEALVPLLLVGGGLFVILTAMRRRRLADEMRHRERLAMIERGLTPPPEVDPGVFGAEAFGGLQHAVAWGRQSTAGSRFISLGISVVGIGVALMVLITAAAGEAAIGFGIGGAIAVIGVAFILNGMLQRAVAGPPPAAHHHQLVPEPAAHHHQPVPEPAAHHHQPVPERPLGPTDPPGPVGP